MYHYNLHIITCGLSEAAIAVLKAVPPQDNFTHVFTSASQLLAADLDSSDIYIYSGPVTKEVIELLTADKKSAYSHRVLFASPDILKMDDYALSLKMDAVWPYPLSDKAMAGYFTKVLTHIKQDCDQNLVETYLDTLIDNMPDMVWFKDKNGAHLKVNKKFCQVVNKTKEEIQGRGHCYIWDLDPQEYADGEYVCMETEKPVLEQGKSFMFEETVKYGNTPHYLNTYKSPIFDRNGQVIGTVGFAKDITDVWNVRSELRLILNAAPTPFILFDANLKVSSVNTEFCKFFQVEEKNILNKKGLEKNSLLLPGLSIRNKQEISKDICRYDFIRSYQNKTYVFRGTLHQLRNADGDIEGSLLMLTDLTAEHETIERTYRLSITDSLTGVFNRTFYRSMVEQKVLHNDSFVLVLADLDKLKNVNDNYGHSSGDEYIISSSVLLRKAFGNKGTVCRIGGDEFAVFVEDYSPEDVDKKLAEVNVALEQMGLAYHASISYGLEPVQVSNFEDFRKASNALDKKLYDMKESKNLISCTQSDVDI